DSPRVKPGKSLGLALLPAGQDPAALVRSGGREAAGDVIDAARPLAEMLWARETEGHSFDTPERRAALEARVNEVTSAIGDEAVRRYYRQDFNARLAQFFAPHQAQQQRGDWREPRRSGNWRELRNNDWPRRNAPRTGGRAQPYVVVSRELASSPVHRGHRTTVPRREALILQAALN